MSEEDSPLSHHSIPEQPKINEETKQKKKLIRYKEATLSSMVKEELVSESIKNDTTLPIKRAVSTASNNASSRM